MPVSEIFVQNPAEATLAHQVTEALLRSGVRESQIGVISLCRQQIKLSSHLLQDLDCIS
jgi:DNA replication ATP-dependent helicase Dna2